MSFASLGLPAPLLNALSSQGLLQPTPVQAAAIPAALQGRDVLAQAPTGSGKTLAFGLPLLAQYQAKSTRQPAALVLLPTRELAAQVGEQLHALALAQGSKLKLVVAYGGVAINPQLMALRGGADIVVATPGRLLDLVEHNGLALGRLQTLVLDEADRLLDMGFAAELQRILALLPAQRQTLLFSATFPDDVNTLAAQWLRDPLRIQVAGADQVAPAITQRTMLVDEERRTALLIQLLKQEDWAQLLVFIGTHRLADKLAVRLQQAGISAAALHGELSQGRRSQTLAGFKAGHLRVLLATDVAARGIDIAELPAVLNYDLPRSATDYQHRIGRTGRAGASGLAISFVTPASEAHFRLIEKRQGQRVARETLEGFAPQAPAPLNAAGQHDGKGGIKGKRMSKKDKLRAAAAQAAGTAGQDDGE
ncbi:DEAD/DEAH box helicase [Chitinimonas taiwanensis]|uniref:Superfamily II DNA and RNA helicase n=1 Tax=Chitinimonas taiwanensis DSM 18899 TaxID=1121279 RepID=A0A1K2HF07_9NEIS|nr:DEAD/DEAH box helicase [Chitinimonas taiwanensis]SFZ75366.1 Superfamily II DNA and RNA helicase [Chitinimonas taiwanensis DSM 18899]